MRYNKDTEKGAELMIKDNQTKLNKLHVVLDGVITTGSFLLAWYIRFESGLMAVNGGYLTLNAYIPTVLVLVPVYLLLYAGFKLYTPKRIQSRRSEFSNICQANTIGFLLLNSVLFIFASNPYLQYYSRKMLAVFYILNIVLQTLERWCIRSILHSMRSKGYNQKHILLIGYSRTAEGFIDRIRQNPQWGYQVRGILDDHADGNKSYKGVQVIGKISSLNEILSMNLLDEIAITLSIHEYGKLEQIVAACEKSGVHTKFIPDYNNVIPTRPYTEDLEGLPVINIRHVPLNNPLNAAIKRVVDIVGALFGLVVFSPLMLLVAILIKLTSPGPVIYSQERIGLHNLPFKMYKFRSMEVQAPAAERNKWTTPHDPRVTSVGRFIRKTSIDELPQFYNILIGNMSLVGPRPERPYFVERFKEEIPRYMVKHQVRPGLTGWAQVNGYRGDTSITKRIEHDLYYIENWTLTLDFKIMFLTIFKGFINKNAY